MLRFLSIGPIELSNPRIFEISNHQLVDMLTCWLVDFPKNGVFWGIWLIRVNFVIFFGECYAI